MITQKEFNVMLLQINEAFKTLEKRLTALEEEQKKSEQRIRRDLYKKIRDNRA